MSKKIEKRIHQEFAKYAIPAVTGMVVSSLYNIVDGIFVGRGVGDLALAAINIVFPFIMLQIGIVMLISIGGANLFSASRGKGDNESANKIFLQCIYLLGVLGVAINVLVLLFTPTVCRLLGATDTLLPYVKDYLRWIALFNIINMPGLGLSIFIRNDNAPRREMIGTLAGTVVNIILDYLFIMVFKMGIAGAAIATGIGQVISVLIFMTHFLQKNRVLRFGKVKWDSRELKRILYGGIPSFLMEFSQSAISYSYNLVLLTKIGANGVSYYSIVMYICSIFNMILIGLVQGAQPIMSYHYGSGEISAIQQVKSIAIRTALTVTSIIYVVIFFTGKHLAKIFVPDNIQLTEQAGVMMKYYFLAFFPIGIILITILFFQVTERSGRAVLLSFLRCVGFVQLFLFLLPILIGNTGIYLAFLCGECCNCFLSLLLEKIPEQANKTSLRIHPSEEVENVQ